MAETKLTSANRKLRQRAAENRIIRQEELRKKFQGVEYISQIERDYKELADLSEGVKKAKATKSNPLMVSDVIAKADSRAKIIKIKMDTNFRRLKFILPELKSMELTDPNGNNPLDTLGNALVEAVNKLNG